MKNISLKALLTIMLFGIITISTQAKKGTACSLSATVPNDTVCGGNCNGILFATVAGGTPPYTFAWSTGATTSSITNLCAGTYSFTVNDALGCTFSTSASVDSFANIPSLVVTPTITNATCAGDYDGSIVLSATAPTSPFRYNWAGKSTLNGIYNIPVGTYSVTIWDSKNNCSVFSYKDTAANSNCGIIYGNIVNDTNFTCTYNSKDPGINWAYVTINPGGYIFYPKPYGYYYSNNIYFPYGSYTVTQTINTGSPLGACSSTLPVTVSSSTPSTDFTDTTHVTLSDPEVTYLYADVPEPGQPYSAQFQIKNIGNDSSYGRTYITIPDSMTFVSTTPAYSSMGHDTVYWNYTSLLPGDTLDYTLNCTAYSLSSINNVVDWVIVGVIPSNPESDAGNDGKSIVCGWAYSMDPNYKLVSPCGSGPQGYINLTDSILTYTIHFQNTGTASAHNIYVMDTIDSHLDINSLDVLGSSKSYSYQVKGNVIKFIFSNINLPDSTASPGGSQAWIQYRLKQKSSNKSGDVINNTGYVFFDYNAPVVTNTTTNTIQTPLGISSKPLQQPDLSIYPNPASNNVQLTYNVTKPSSTQIQIIDLLGKVVYDENKGIETVGTKTENISTTMLTPGTYFVKFTANNISVNKKLIIIR